MKERILRVLMFFALIFAIGLTVIIAIFETEDTLKATATGIGAIVSAATIQYILLGEWHPMYLFRNNDKN